MDEAPPSRRRIRQLEVVVAETEQGRGIVGVIDGASPKGVEGEADKASRKTLLRNFGYKIKS